jgi:hypothetical protein
VCTTKINNKIVSEERGETRKDARDNSALRAMQTMSPEPPPPAQALEIVKLAMNQYTLLTQHIKVFLNFVLKPPVYFNPIVCEKAFN